MRGLEGSAEGSAVAPQGAGTWLLFAPPLAPLALDEGAELVLGRGAECSLTLPSRRASRRHAVVRREDERAFVRDLGSTNGTFVNGESLAGERELFPGDRVEIGDSAVTVCRVNAAAPLLSGDPGETILADRTLPAEPQVLAGDLVQIPLFVVLQMLEMGCKTGALTLEGPVGGRLWLEGGRLVHADDGKDEGLPAALALAAAERGRFHFSADSKPESPTFEASVTEVILEATRLLDEGEA